VNKKFLFKTIPTIPIKTFSLSNKPLAIIKKSFSTFKNCFAENKIGSVFF